MAYTHDDTLSAIVFGNPRGDLETFRESNMGSSKRVIAGDRKVLVESGINTLAIMLQGRRLSMQDFAGELDITTINIEHALSNYRIRQLSWPKRDDEHDLLAHADTEDGDLASKMSNDISANARIRVRMAGPGTDDKLGWLFGDELVNGDFVVPDHLTFGTGEAQVLVDIPSEGVIVVNEDQVGSCRDRVSRLGVVRGVINQISLVRGRHFG